MLAINQTLQGRYRIVRQLGHGGMGAVYEAIDERFGEPIALKEIIFDSIDEKQKEMVGKAFEREAKALAKAKHEVVPFVRDYFSELDRQYLVMELVEGEDLGAMLEKRKAPFALADILDWMNQLLDALDYLHNLKPEIIHRDIKPQNLKLNTRRRIKLLDFGIARSGDKSTTITKQTFVGATLNYSPIEQILRVIDATFREFIILKHKEKAEAVLSQDTDARCDIYALGGTFYHLLTNHAPIDATKRTLELWEGKADPLPNPSALNPNIPISISNCLLKAMSVERDERFSSALEMHQTLKSAIANAEKIEADSTRRENVTQAETIPLITKEDLKIEKPTEPLLVFNSAPTQPVEIPLSNTQPTAGNSGFGEAAKTIPSGDFSKFDLTSGSYLVGVLPEKKKTSPEIPSIFNPPIEEETGSRQKLFWAIPIALIGFLAVAGIGGLGWLAMSLISPASNNSASNAVVSTPTATPVATPISTATPNVSTTVTPTALPATQATPIPTQNKPEKVKPVAVATPNKTPAPAPVKTPQAKQTPKPKQDPNCIFTNSCQ